jgi:hypothetical protein
MQQHVLKLMTRRRRTFVVHLAEAEVEQQQDIENATVCWCWCAP